MKLPELLPIKYAGVVYRNIFTCSPSQALYDDVADPKDYPLVDQAVQWTSEIDHGRPQVERPFQYGSLDNEEVLAIFDEKNWKSGRFGDGRKYGVWYSAEDPFTSVYETLWWATQLAKDNVLLYGEVYTTDRKMFQTDLQTDAAVDLTATSEFTSSLIHPHDYEFCQRLGRELWLNKMEMLRTLSARKKGGICTPLFCPTPIQKCEFIYYLKYNISPDGFVGVSSSQEEMNFSLNVSRLQNPYSLEKPQGIPA